MAWIENTPCYENFYLSDDVMSIAGSKLDGKDWSYEQRKFFALVGLSKLCIGKYKYTPTGERGA
eukprot:9784124-Ditylum_brightwellii.AAC.1